MRWLKTLIRVILRPLRQEPVRTLLTLLAVSLGVAVVVAIELAGTASVANFRSSLQAVAGRAAFEIAGVGGVDERLLGTLSQAPLPLEYVARIEDHATVKPSGPSVPLIGIDLVAAASKAGAISGGSGPLRQDGVWLGERLIQAHPQTIRLLINDEAREYPVLGRVPGEAGAGADTAVVMDLAAAQRVTRKLGRLDRIEVYTPPGDPAVYRAELERLLPVDATLAEAGIQTAENRKMLDGFRWNVRILSYIALVVGAFLIYNTIAVSVVRRRNEIGVLRALGASRRFVLSLFLGEAALFGLGGALLGIVFGRVLAEGAVRLMGLTVDALYVSGSVAPVVLTWREALLAVVAGTGIAVAAALAPAREAASVQPTEAMARGRHTYQVITRTGRYGLQALAALALAGVLSQLPPFGNMPWWGYLAALLLIAAASLASPLVVTCLTLLLDGVARRLGAEAMLASRSLRASLWRSAVLTAAVAVAIAMMVSIGMMVGSFRQSVVTWLEAQLVADFYLRPAGAPGVDRHPSLDVRIADDIERLPGVAAVDRFKVYEIRYGGGTATLAGGQTAVAANFNRITFLPGTNRDGVMEALREHEAVVVSEPFSNKHHVRTGDTITLALGGAQRRFTVWGIYYDYASERGYIIMDRRTLLKYLPDPHPSNLAVYVRPGFDAGQVRRDVERIAAPRNVLVFPSAALRREAIRTFDRTFAITYALEAVAIAVAVMGVAGSLLALVYDRRREIGLLRFLGASTGQVRKLIVFEAGFVGLFASALGVVLGVLLGLLLIFVINKQSFGWTIQLHWPVQLMLYALSGVYVATLLAALYPARVATRLVPIEVVHAE